MEAVKGMLLGLSVEDATFVNFPSIRVLLAIPATVVAPSRFYHRF